MGLFSKLDIFRRGRRPSRITASIRPKKAPDLRTLILRPRFAYGITAVLCSAILLTGIVAWGRSQPRIWVGEIATNSLVNPVEFTVRDVQETQRRRDEAGANATRYYSINAPVLDRLRAKIVGLPLAVREVVNLDSVDPGLREEFNLKDNDLGVLQRYSTSEGATPTWVEASERFIQLLWSHEPLLDSQEFQIFATTPERKVIPPGEKNNNLAAAIEVTRAIDLESDSLDTRVREDLLQLARRAGFPRDAGATVVAPLLRDPSPTVLFDTIATDQSILAAQDAVPEVNVAHARGEVIYARGDVVTKEQENLARRSLANAFSHGGYSSPWLRILGWGVLAAILALMMAGHGVIFYPQIARSTSRLVGLLGLVVGCTALATLAAIEVPRLLVFGSVLSVCVLGILLTLAYDRRIAIFATILTSITICVATGKSMGFAVALVAIGASLAAQLGEVANRGAFVRAAVISAIAALVTFAAVSMATIPLESEGAIRQILGDTLLAGGATITAGFIMLGIMPPLERAFDITTGLTLAELRDSRQPLLRQLQARAPGTYNHSLAVATIAENAAEAIGADSRLIYVGGLYHDIGKINKPEYFIENQGGRGNKHDKLSPAMSLLVIVGHVKDGLELAREYGLPKVLRHFIESHHGTSLVEYFFHAARERAATEGSDVEEFEYRYPGPRPRTREAAILLLCDGIESATRAMSDPTPSSIEALVRRMSRRRLEDGQLDESPLTFRELHIVEDAIVKSLCAIYHSRISYPGKEEEDAAPTLESQAASP
ncbi:MAG: HDIG domain-containing protein [Phycisphaerales bacterium]|nr:HDIG domain-containing protein [Phycisphaerales bacterium]